MTTPAFAAQAKIVYKQHSTSTIIPGAEPVFSSDPGTSGGQTIRRVSSSLQPTRTNFKSNEVRQDLQVLDLHLGQKGGKGTIIAELSPGTWQDWLGAIVRGTWAAAVSHTQSDFTSLAATLSTNKLTVGGSTWAAQGYRVGDIVRISSFDPQFNGNNILITALNGVDMTPFPKVTADVTADTSFTVATIGKKVQPPLSSQVLSKWVVEQYQQDTDLSELYTEGRLGTLTITAPAEGMITVAWDLMFRDWNPESSGSSPFFTSPTAATTSSPCSTVNGALSVNGVVQGVVTQWSLKIDLNQATDTVQGTYFMPEIFQGNIDVSGSMTVDLTDLTLPTSFFNENPFELALMVANGGATSDYVSFFMANCKFTDAQQTLSGYKGRPITLPFTALLKPSTTGYDNTTITIQDSLAS